MNLPDRINSQIFIGDYIDFLPHQFDSSASTTFPSEKESEKEDEDLFKKILREYLTI